jgi:hypothetical protein
MDLKIDKLPLHDVILPSNWLISPHKFSVTKEVKLGSISSLLNAIENLINTLLIDDATGRAFTHSADRI